jgi:hypothetical protein
MDDLFGTQAILTILSPSSRRRTCFLGVTLLSAMGEPMATIKPNQSHLPALQSTLEWMTHSAGPAGDR